MHFLQKSGLAAVILMGLDALYLGIRKESLRNQIQQVQQHAPMKLRISGIIMCYVCLVVGWYYFILRPHKSVWEAILFGLVIYGTYEATNWASLRDWQLDTLVVDTLWGGALFGISTWIFYFITKRD